MANENSKIERIVEEINSKNAKKVAFLMILSFACYHALLHVKYDVKYGKYCFYHNPKVVL